MADDHEREPTPKTQLTQPHGIDPKTGKPYEGIEIPVPKRRDVMDFLEKTAQLPDPDRSASESDVLAKSDSDRAEH